MPKASPIQYAFNGGRLGTRMQGRSDLARYATGCNVLRNFIPTYQGPAIKRSGFRHVKPVKDETKRTRVLSFEFSVDDAYILELGEGYMRVYKDGGAVLETAIPITGVTAANPVVVTAANSYSAGDQVFITGSAQTELNGRFFTVASPTGSNFELSGEDGTGRSTGSGGTAARVFEIEDGVASNSLPWLAADLDAIQYAQVADVIYLVHGSYPPHKIERTSDTQWTCTQIAFDWPAFREENTNRDIKMIASHNDGSSRTVQLRGTTKDGIGITSHNTATPIVVTASGSHGYSTGDTVFITGTSESAINDKHYVITVTGATTFSLDGSTGASGGTGGTVELIPDTSFQFTADMVGSFIKLREIKGMDVAEWQKGATSPDNLDARSATTWHAMLIYFDANVYQADPANSGAVGQRPPVHDRSADGQSGYVSDGNAGWAYYNSFAGYGTITAVASDGYSCTVDVDVPFPYCHSLSNPSETARSAQYQQWSTARWSIGAFNDEHCYPKAVGFYEDRLWLGGTKKDPQTFWGSRTGDYENFEIIADQDDSAVVFTLASDRLNSIEWMSGEDVLLIGTRGGEFTADAGSADQAITPSNIRVRRRSSYGSFIGVQPLFIDSALLFVHRSGERLHELSEFPDTDYYTAPDLTQMSYDVLSSGVVGMAYQSAPFRILWVALSDGSLASLTYVRDEEILAWATHEIGGTDAAVESIAVIPHTAGDQDQLWAVTKRTVNGSTVRHIEVLERPFAEEAVIEDAFFVDDGLTYEGAATTSITGLDHLEGETVSILADGFVIDDQVVSGGAVTLTSAAEKVHVGLPMPEARLQTMRIEAGARDGTSMGKKGRIFRLIVRVNDLGEGLYFGTDFDTMRPWSLRKESDNNDTPTALYTGDSPSFPMPSGYERERRIALAHRLPLPATIVATMPQLDVESV